MHRRQFALGLGSATILGAVPARAQAYPSRNIRLIVPFAPGGPSDTLGRAFAQQLSELLGQPVVVENKAGAGGTVGIALVARAPTDGYTLGWGTSGPLAANATLYKTIPYDPAKDLTAISLFAFMPNVIAALPTFPANNPAELITLLRANSGKYKFAHGGSGTSAHLTGELLKITAGVQMDHIAYKGENPAMTDLMGGHVPLLSASFSGAIPAAKAGKIKIIGVTSKTRSALLPNVPAFAEVLPGFEIGSWYALVGPAGLPADVLRRLNTASVQLTTSPRMAERLSTFGATATPSTPEEAADYIRAEIDHWGRIIKQAGIEPE